MITTYIVGPNDEPDYDSPHGTVDLRLGGIYFFLYPYLLTLQQRTGQMIDPQGYADFDRDGMLCALEQLSAAKDAAELCSLSFPIHVAKEFGPVPREVYEDVSKPELLAMIETITSMMHDALDKGCRVIFAGE